MISFFHTSGSATATSSTSLIPWTRTSPFSTGVFPTHSPVFLSGISMSAKRYLWADIPTSPLLSAARPTSWWHRHHPPGSCGRLWRWGTLGGSAGKCQSWSFDKPGSLEERDEQWGRKIRICWGLNGRKNDKEKSAPFDSINNMGLLCTRWRFQLNELCPWLYLGVSSNF